MSMLTHREVANLTSDQTVTVAGITNLIYEEQNPAWRLGKEPGKANFGPQYNAQHCHL